MKSILNDFITYMSEEKKASDNTVISYGRDLKKLYDYLKSNNIFNVEDITEKNLNDYILNMYQKKMADSSISRNIVSIKSFFKYLYKNNIVSKNISEDIKPPKIQKKIPNILTEEKIQLLLSQPSDNTPKAIRDKAMLELLYATGIRVTELIDLKIEDIDLSMGYIICKNSVKERAIPIGEHSKTALNNYINNVRNKMLHEQKSDLLFVNCSGDHMSRQGFWKIIKQYAKKASIEEHITPHTLRHSFAAHLIQNGADIHAVQEMMGHAEMISTQIYASLDSNEKVRDVYIKSHPRT